MYKRLNDNHYFNQKSQAKHSLQKSEVKFIDSKLKDREKQFCACYAETGDVRLSARLAGYRMNSRAKGIKLLSRDDIREEIENLLISKEKLAKRLAVLGYRRLAFSGVNDAVSLICSENATEQDLSGMDFYMISEIKKPKDGALEVKFFDRIKALEKLENACADTSAKSLFDAIGGQGGEGDD